jgi:Na+/H+ antiporter NhaD/arsenite permease-like protein
MKKSTIKTVVQSSLIKLLQFARQNMLFTISAVAAILTMFLVPPDAAYLGYFDWKTLVCLFSVLVIVRAISATGFFSLFAGKLVGMCGNLRSAVFLLIALTLIGSLLITNDMALLAFLPLGYYILHHAGAQRYLAYVFIVQTMAANLGGMLTPFGNPQNLYLYSFYHINTSTFFKIMLPPFIVCVLMTALCCLSIKPLQIKASADPLKEAPNMRQIGIYLTLFLLVLLTICRILPYPLALIAPVVIGFLDRATLKQADYPLLGTFCAFFVFSGNLSRLPIVESFLGEIVQQHTLLVGAAVSQVISNVPAAVLLSKFTDNYTGLLLGVNLGGVGTPVASLASLITIRHFMQYQPTGGASFAKKFAVMNIGFLGILLLLFAGL